MGIPAWAHYRDSELAGISCGTCDYIQGGRCTMFENTPVEAGYVCDEWQGRVDKQDPAYAPMYTPVVPPPVAATPEGLIDTLGALEPEPQVQKADGALYLISHAKTRYNKPGAPHDMVQGWRDIPLDQTGRGQARKLGQFLKGAGVDQVYASDLKRAKQTAEIAGSRCGAVVKSDRSYRPWNLGSFAGHSSADVVPKLKPYMTDKANEPVDGGESFSEYTSRFVPALEKLIKQAESGKTIALVTHSRNVELAEGWLGGMNHRSKVDTGAIEADEIEPATVFKIAPGKNGKMKLRQVADETVSKGQARPAVLHLRVHGMTRHPSGQMRYRMITRDNHYVGMTLPTNKRALKGAVLKIQANDFGRNPNGDFHWVNPDVISHYSDSAHSLRELVALAGGTLAKDFAAGAGGDAPPAGDAPMGTSQMPSAGTLAAMEPAAMSGTGPTINAVHRNKPLKTISVAYMNRKVKVRVYKADRHKQLIYGVVLEPNALDSQDDYMLPDQVEKAAHGYMKKVVRGKAAVSKLQHVTRSFHPTKASVIPVESFIAPTDFSYDGHEMIKKGTWVMCVHCEDGQVWQDVLDGKYTGFSIGGTGIRRSMHVPPNMVERGYIDETQPADWFGPSGRAA